nr:adaptive-response sensory-kinase SasA [uncultured bacterium]
MFWSQLKRLHRSVTFRLTAWYVAIFGASLLVLFFLMDVALARSLRKQDAQLVADAAKEIADEYNETGVNGVATYVREQEPPTLRVLLVGRNGETLFSSKARGAKNAEHFETYMMILYDGVRLEVRASDAMRRHFLTRFRTICGAILLPMTAFGILGGSLLARRMLRPIRDLSEAVKRVQETTALHERIPTSRAPGELMDLVQSFNQMLVRIEHLVESIRGSLDNVAHELRTPMTRLRTAAEMALRKPNDFELARSALADCVEESERLMSLLNSLTDMAEAEAGAMKLYREPLDVARLAARVTDLYADIAEDKGISLRVSAPETLILDADPNRLPQAIANLVDNAIKYTASGGHVVVQVQRQNGAIAISVKDTGIGIGFADREKVWQRLYRADTSRSERGLGLGLAVAKAIVEAHGGRIGLESEPNRGSTFTVHLPTR